MSNTKRINKREDIENKPYKSAKKRSKSSSKIKISKIRIIIFLVITAITLSVGFLFKPQLENVLNGNRNAGAPTDSNAKVLDQNGLSVHFIDVGQGDSIAIRFPDGKTMLVDAGPTSSKSNLIDYLKNKFFAQDENVFNYVLLTHSDSDHCGGMASVCENFVVNTIYRPYSYCVKYDIDEVAEAADDTSQKETCDSTTYYNTIKAFKNEIDEHGNTAEMIWTELYDANHDHKISGEVAGKIYSIDFYAPTEKYVTKSAGTKANDYSPIMVLNYNGKKIMLTGDASTTSEENAMKNATLPDVDLLKVGHHGSKTSSGEKFLQQIKPEIAVISVGEGNTYHHPTTEALNRLQSVGATIYRTDQNGTVVANVTSVDVAELNIFVSTGTGTTSSVYIHIEYVMAGVVLLALSFCYGIKIKS